MLVLGKMQFRRALCILISFHILVIAASNYLVQLPIEVFGLHTTWGTFSFPFVYLATDLTVRIFGDQKARTIIFGAMLPALITSYVISVLFFEGTFQGFAKLAYLNTFIFRIALASFTAYLLGQLVDIKIFSQLRKHKRWWIAPAGSTICGNLLDTIVFYSVAFWASSDAFMGAHWPEIAAVDYGFKLFISILLFLPLYGVLLRAITNQILAEPKLRVIT
ncbi:MAG: 7-cyano-7-deazaguanine/7-aminomethyl-7-deazaguanine transporter [Desulfobacterales bacterium]|nr:7-cyano-7-deazaguanine/7-aminomethyl-7-deazaguanine transporter [Deltaproteobacteria bacterium]NNK93543.1 7-cyano-7-deazaguanine/7-aminomethyl-7-deazaguanine transporter [Desulfobacterales bacterium]